MRKNEKKGRRKIREEEKKIHAWERRKKWERKKKGSVSKCSDGRKSIGRELKLVYSSRAMNRC